MVYLYDKIDGKDGRKLYDAARAGTIWSILYHPGSAVRPANPLTINRWVDLLSDEGGIGLYTFRNQYDDASDIIAQYLVKRYAPGGHSGPDAGSFRIIGLDGAFAVGGGRYGPKLNGVHAFVRSMNTVYPVDPETGPMDKRRGSRRGVGKVVGDAVVRADGSGHVVSRHQTNDVGTTNFTRRFLADMSGDSGAAGVFVIADTSDNGKFWQLCTVDTHKMQKAARGFGITAPSGSTLKATILHAADDPNVTLGTRIRGSRYHDRTKNNYATIQTDDGGFLVVLTLQPKGKKHPAVSGDGYTNASPTATVTVGRARYKVTADTINRAN